ncbi:glutamate-5-semialdehyde dehydrogenase [Blautia sp. HCP3S3_G3]|uniref:glutamate-5-semialdehyde dehydrogenase n=1 Tax=Blautia sp. HCP3S3_G3 TaxID=3438913 RepID=UPI003F8CE9A4
MSVLDSVKAVKKAEAGMASQPEEVRNRALEEIGRSLEENQKLIFEANAEDMEQARKEGKAAPILKRLELNADKLQVLVSGIQDLIHLPDPLFKTQLARELDKGLTLYRESCPIGTIGIIFEARPDALVQISTLCVKSGNCVILKGGSEAARTNRVLFQLIYQAVLKAGLPENCLLQLEDREEIAELLKCSGYVDLLIPRGSNNFVRYIMENTKIPVMGHADGICHIYVDREADLEKAVPIIFDAKTQYVAACNTVETLLVHREIAAELLPKLKEAMDGKVEIRGTEEVQRLISCAAATEEDFAKEYMDYIISVKLVDSLEEAIEHINTYGSHHTDCIITEDAGAAEKFMRMVDSAGVYQNCSTRFADGYRYGFGAEVGISTSKIHARGPVGLEGLVSYKYKLFGSGQIVGDYASGKSQFHFRDL